MGNIFHFRILSPCTSDSTNSLAWSQLCGNPVKRDYHFHFTVEDMEIQTLWVTCLSRTKCPCWVWESDSGPPPLSHGLATLKAATLRSCRRHYSICTDVHFFFSMLSFVYGTHYLPYIYGKYRHPQPKMI